MHWCTEAEGYDYLSVRSKLMSNDAQRQDGEVG
jgi:hypothetical protein